MTYSLTRTALTRTALQLASSIRRANNLGPFLPVPIFDLCERIGISVQHLDFSMEGMYVSKAEPSILISSLRPLGRRAFTCAHELGHHFLGHGTSFDKLADRVSDAPEEISADAFAGFFLMPILGIRKAFTQRAWNIRQASSTQMYTVACQFGVGYESLIAHLAYSAQEIDVTHAELLRKVKLPAVRKEMSGLDLAGHLMVVDEHWSLPTVDLEVGNKLLLPNGWLVDRKSLSKVNSSGSETLYEAASCGLSQVHNSVLGKSMFVRICKSGYVGFNENRFLEEDEDDES